MQEKQNESRSMGPFEERLSQVMYAYRKTSIDNTISDAIILTSTDEDRLFRAGAAVLGFSRSKHYVDVASTLIEQIGRETAGINWYSKAIDDFTGELSPANPKRSDYSLTADAASKLKVGSMVLSLHQEVMWHFYAQSLTHSWHFLVNSFAQVVPSMTVSEPDKQWLNLTIAFRNHMEHRDKAVANVASGDWDSMREIRANSLVIGYKLDQVGNIRFTPMRKPLIGVPQTFPMNRSGFIDFRARIDRMYEELRHQCCDNLERFFKE